VKSKILKVNKFYLPIAVAPWREVVKNIFTDAVYPLDIIFATDDDGKVLFDEYESFEVVRSWEAWLKVPVRSYDEFLNSPSSRMRLPSVVVCADYDKIPTKRAVFPTRKNIWERDKFVCGYTGKKLTKKELSVDHIIPKSRCLEFGIKEPNTWENLVTCSKVVNNEKDNRTPAEAGLELRITPYKPRHGRIFSEIREQWKPFLDPK
jgi:5-methylcytosine-specific restriction endonuclease McrA